MSRTEKIINAIMAVFLLAIIYLFAYKTLWPNRRALLNSVRRMDALEGYLDDDYNALDMFSARINSFDSKLNEVMWKKDELGYLNSSFQYALGKKMIATGTTRMIVLPTGDLYDLPEWFDTTPQTDEIIAFSKLIDVPLTYIFEHPTTYPGNMPEGGYARLDPGSEMSDTIVTALRAGGIDLIDSRDVLKDEDTKDTIMRTDQHWTTYAGLLMARSAAEHIGLDASLLDPENFDQEVYPEKFMGKFGQKVGPNNVTPDDIIVWSPKYDTHISRYTLFNGKETDIEGTFKEAAVKWKTLEGEGWNTKAYKDYGLTEDFEHYHNDNAADVTLLVYKDSFGCPVGTFLSLVARDVYLVDMRKSDEDAKYYVDKYQPDHVIMSFSRPLLCLYEYELIKGFDSDQK